MDDFFERRVPGLVHALGFGAFRVDTAIGVGMRDEPAYEAMRLAWPQVRRAAGATGIEEADLICLDEAFDSSTTLMVTMVLVAAWDSGSAEPPPHPRVCQGKWISDGSVLACASLTSGPAADFYRRVGFDDVGSVPGPNGRLIIVMLQRDGVLLVVDALEGIGLR